MDYHVIEIADAYALGALEESDVRRVETHLATCEFCTQTIGEAEEFVTRLVTSTTKVVDPPARLGARIAASAGGAAPRSRVFGWQRWGALAAAVALSVGLNVELTRETVSLRTAAVRNDVVLGTIATSHFKHATLSAVVPGAPTAKVIYAPDRSWFYVIVDAANCRCHVVVGSAGRSHDLGAPQSGPQVSTLFAKGDRPDVVALFDDSGRLIASADLE